MYKEKLNELISKYFETLENFELAKETDDSDVSVDVEDTEEVLEEDNFKRRDYVLIISNQKYPYENIHERTMRIQKLLLNIGFNKEDIQVIKEVNKKVFNRYLNIFIKKTENEAYNKFIFVYIGKSYTNETENNQPTYLVMNDYTNLSESDSDKNINFINFINRIKSIKNVQALFLFDTCIKFPASVKKIAPISFIKIDFYEPILQFIALCEPNDRLYRDDIFLVDYLSELFDLEKNEDYIAVSSIYSYIKFRLNKDNINPQYGAICQNANCKGNFIFELKSKLDFSDITTKIENDKSMLTIIPEPSDAKIFIMKYRSNNKSKWSYFKSETPPA